MIYEENVVCASELVDGVDDVVGLAVVDVDVVDVVDGLGGLEEDGAGPLDPSV